MTPANSALFFLPLGSGVEFQTSRKDCALKKKVLESGTDAKHEAARGKS